MTPLIPHIASTQSLLDYIANGPHPQADWTKAKESETLEAEDCRSFIQLTGGRLAIAVGDGYDYTTIKIWKKREQCVANEKQWKCIATLSGNQGVDSFMELSGRHMASIGMSTIKIWDTFSFECIGIIYRSNDTVFTPISNRWLARSGTHWDLSIKKWEDAVVTSTIDFYDMNSMSIPTLTDEAHFFFLSLFKKAVFPHTAILTGEKAQACACYRQSYKGFLEVDKPRKDFLEAHKRRIIHLAQLPNSRLASASKKTIKIWNYAPECQPPYSLWKTFKGFSSIKSLVPFSDSELAVSDKKTIKICDLDSSEPSVLGEHSGSVRTLIKLSEKLLASSDNETIKIWDVTGHVITLISGDDDLDGSLLQLDNGQLMHRSGDTIQIWDLTSQQCVENFNGVDIIQLSNGQLAIRNRRYGFLSLWTLDKSLNIKAFAKVLNTLTDRGKNVMVSCLEAMKKAGDKELIDSFDYILEKSQEWIVEEFDRVLKNSDSLTIELIKKMLKRLVCTADIPFPYILIHMAHESGKFTKTELEVLNRIFIRSLTHIAENYIYSSICKARFDLLLDIVCQQGMVEINELEKRNLSALANVTQMLNDPRSKDIERRLNEVELKLINLGSHVVKLQDYVNENAKFFLAQLNNFSEAIRQKEKITTIASCVNVVISIIPLIGPVTKAVSDVLVGSFNMILNSSVINPAMKSMFQHVPQLLQENAGSIIKYVAHFVQGQVIDPEKPLKNFANEAILKAADIEPFKSNIDAEITNEDRPDHQSHMVSLQMPASNRLPEQFANLLSPNST